MYPITPAQYTYNRITVVRFSAWVWRHFKATAIDEYISNNCHYTRPTLVQIMTCRLFGTKSSSEPMLAYCYLLIGPLGTNFSPKFSCIHERRDYYLIQSYSLRRNLSEIWNKIIHFQSQKCIENFVCKMATILARPQCVKARITSTQLNQPLLRCVMRQVTHNGYYIEYITSADKLWQRGNLVGLSLTGMCTVIKAYTVGTVMEIMTKPLCYLNICPQWNKMRFTVRYICLLFWNLKHKMPW